ncbi:putative short chain dehydrogenase [Ordospora colligata]|uniref:Putative short chain dehydrogenase n=1 Tax=Ordospora colligata OC4 TaxID=1354746 RepID=A0A0B2UEZ1_9MICR|nr:putative short chain dehydrogenase [Ordospora colligata OC4]KHN69641.1 putative short chain dehydrogenase [Ordospora colligata OC4]TBU15760.1 putative short chain dehydrogenase [Ordospora colligata]TBU15888.1 putative short chain dehydrogenase [Ordospora colligata]TBU18782.1 putative short chain dehydrogenase [Ordospora colligata]
MAALNLVGKSVFVTGASRGLGLEITKELLARGAYVHAIGRSSQPYFHPNLTYHQMDLQLQKPDLGISFDIVISNLGTSVGNKRFCDMEYQEITGMLQMNVELQLWLLKNISYTKFVFINSVLSQQGLPEYSMYCASKAFIHTLNQSLRREGKDTVIIYPYKINTTLFNEIRDVCALDAKAVAVRVVKDIENGTREDFMPWIFGPISHIFRIMPLFIQDLLARIIKSVFYPQINRKQV